MKIISGRNQYGSFGKVREVNGMPTSNELEKNSVNDLAMGPIWAGMITKLIDSMEVKDVLDYKCGQDHPLSEHLTPDTSFKYQAYDAAIEQYADTPKPAEMVVSVGGLSDMSSAGIDESLDEIADLAQSVVFLTAATNRHPLEHWIPKIMDRFALQRVQVAGDGSFCVVAYSLGL